ncbi:MAG: ribosome maturation factor RimM [Chloroflexota bacterium]|nr:ribosome maturation factor RimM [Chloroflexota bacterium]
MPPTNPPDDPRYLMIGEVLRPHGIRGELRIRILTDYPERITRDKTVYLGTDVNAVAKPYTVEGMRMNQEYGLLKLVGINSRETADLLRQLFVLIPLEEAIPLEDGEVYLYELIGMNVQTEDGTPLGELVDVLETGANDVYVVASPQYGEVLLPAIDQCILKIDGDANLMTVHLLDGLLDKR